LFRIDTGYKILVLALYRDLRMVLSRFPSAAFLLVFNMRKKDRRSVSEPNLLSDPRGWLEDICGTLDLMNRSDVRVGVDFCSEEVRVVNGVRRSEDFQPLLIRQVGAPPDGLAGFELCPPDRLSLDFALTSGQKTTWQGLPAQFKFEQAAKTVP